MMSRRSLHRLFRHACIHFAVRQAESKGPLSSPWASPIADSAGRIYIANGGTSIVLASGPEYKVLATNKLNDPNHASPAVAGGRIYLLGIKQLFAIGNE